MTQMTQKTKWAQNIAWLCTIAVTVALAFVACGDALPAVSDAMTPIVFSPNTP